MEAILNEEKDILLKTLSNRMQEFEYRSRVASEQIQQLQCQLEDYKHYERRCDELEVEVRQARRERE